MNGWLWLGVVCLVLAVGVVSLGIYGAARWATGTQQLKAALDANRIAVAEWPPIARYDARELDGLPESVQRYFRAVLKDGQPLVAAVTIEMAGRFNLSATGALWKPFRSRQWVVTRRPGFTWDAQVALLAGLPVRVVDSYIAGIGMLHAAVLGLFTVAQARGEGELARGEFMRFFAEAAWYPTALLPSQGVRWSAVDSQSAKASIADGPVSLDLLFRFNDAGLIDSFRAESRGAGVGKDMEKLPWEGRWSNYQTHNGMTVPMTGEVAWMRKEGRKPYFKGTVTSMCFEFAQT